MTTSIIFNAITLALLIVAAAVINKIWKEKEHYRFRVFDLTNGKEGGNLLKVVPATPPPPVPKKPNIDDVEDENVNKVIEQFDFERARSIMVLTARDIEVPTIDELKKTAKRLLLLCMEHQDREFWWAGGMHHGGICAIYDDKWGLSLIYIEGVSRVKIQQPATPELHVLPSQR